MSFVVDDDTPLIALAGRLFDVPRREVLSLDDRFPGLRNSHFRLLTLIPADGARITDLVEDAGMTKQALGQFVQYLEGLGYVQTTADPSDRRAKIVRKSERGLGAEAAAVEILRSIEERWREQLGDRRFRELRRALRDLADPASGARVGPAASVRSSGPGSREAAR